jgi:hypothetical protein
MAALVYAGSGGFFALPQLEDECDEKNERFSQPSGRPSQLVCGH